MRIPPPANRPAGEGEIWDQIADRRRLRQEQSLTLHTTSERLQQRWLWEMWGVAVLIHPESPMIGRSICSYRSIHWSSLVLIAGMLPLGDALQQTGGTDLVVGALMSVFGDASPVTMLTVIFFLSASLGMVLWNTVSAVMVAPSPSMRRRR